MRCIVIDDEPLALEKMANYIGKTPVLQLVALCESVFDAMQVLATEQVMRSFWISICQISTVWNLSAPCHNVP